MSDLKQFPTKMFGFDKDAVLSYIYEVDSDSQKMVSDASVENKKLKLVITELQNRLKKKDEEIEEINGQYNIIKANFYNSKNTISDLENKLDSIKDTNDKLLQKVKDYELEIKKLKEEINASHNKEEIDITQNKEESISLGPTSYSPFSFELPKKNEKENPESVENIKLELNNIKALFLEKLDSLEQEINGETSK